MALGDIIARLAVYLDLDSASFETGARKAATTTEKMHATMTKAAKGIGVALAGMVTLDGINKLRDMHRAALDAAGGLGEQAKALGVSSTALQQFRFAATQVGLSTEQMDTALGQFSKRLGQAEITGKGPFIAALKQIGLTLDDLKGKSTTDQIALIAEGIKGVGSASQQSALQVQFFGKAGQTMATFLADGAKGVKAFADEAERAGIVLSEGDIAKADEVADKLAKLDYVMNARLNKTMLQHSESLTKAEVAWGEFKIQGIAAMVAFAEGIGTFGRSVTEGLSTLEPIAQGFGRGFTQAFNSAKAAVEGFAGGIKHFGDVIVSGFTSFGNAAVAAVRNMVTQVGQWMGAKLQAALNPAKAIVDQATGWFRNMYDRVVAHSYVPDMVDGIAAHMARLDAVMVSPAKTATERVKQRFEKLQNDVEGIMRRLFPDAATQAGFINDRAALRSGIAAGGAAGFNVPQLQAALKELQSQEFKDAFKDFELSTSDMAVKAEVATVRIGRSFKDMAEEVTSALSGLVNSIKSGDFLGIFEGVVNTVLKLGSAGLFGKGFATKINKIPAFASGTRFAPGGLSLVGERGPELVNLPRGSRVTPNNQIGGGRPVVFDLRGAVVTEDLLRQMNEIGVASAQAGAQMGSTMAVARMQRMESRRLA